MPIALPWSRSGLQGRLLLILLLAFLPGVAIVLFDYTEQRSRVMADAEQSAVSAVRMAANAQLRIVERGKVQVELLAAVPVVRDGAADECTAYVRKLRAGQAGLIGNMGRIEADGRVLCSAVPSPGKRANYSYMYSFHAVFRNGRPVLGSYEFSPVLGRDVLAVMAPIRNDRQGVEAVAFIMLELSSPAELLRRADFPPNTDISLVGSRGRLLAHHPPGTLMIGEVPPELEVIDRLTRDRRAGVLHGVGPEERIYAFARFALEPNNPAMVYASLDTEAIYAPLARRLLRDAMSLMAAMLLLLLAVTWVSRRLVVEPVRRVQLAAQRLAAGQLATRAPVTGRGDELDRLALSFNDMAARLQDRDAELRRLNRLYAVLSSINSLIIRVGGQQELLEESCRIAVRQGGFPLVWVGLVSGRQERWAVVVSFGGTEAERAELVPRVGSAADAHGALSRACASGRPTIYPPAGRAAYWHQRLDPARYARCIVLPFGWDGGEVAGCLNLFLSDTHRLDAAEMCLLQELAADIAHALQHLRQAERLAVVSVTDPLTGLANEARFRDRVEMALGMLRREQQPGHLVVIVLALQGLREVNAVHGLSLGDQVLRTASERLRGLLPEQADLARLRAAVFGITLVEAPGAERLSGLLHMLSEQMSGNLGLREPELALNACIGVSLWPADGDSAGTLLQHAETALATAKAGGSRFRYFVPELQRRAEERLALESALHRALERRELYLRYQPVVAVEDRRLLGVETLLRWRHPELGPVSPARFVPVAESAGLMLPIGTWVMGEAFRQARELAQRSACRLKVAVNLSVSQLKAPDFLQVVDAALEESGSLPGNLSLGLELTETELMEDAPQTIAQLRALRERGFSISVDDFGTGYSSLAYLEKFPVDTLKIDVAFIRDLAENPASGSIVQAIIALARALGMSVIAEGVETREQYQRLAEYGCDAIQGYLFGAGLAPEDLKLDGQPWPFVSVV
ncbi:EAL domain-containing protein [Alkalilimnicola sp. S0819]|uniref:bifunctional diguanylate cyclase/phosphodiesterase n=1 Tax=Alkalilimnicola sp. S0819 TaxID=2613922 RepID=UPI0012622228|nr:EAL domain-containing protein [Alkalilimnicola sp. S0819]KAB7619518.1 EAL domain-containing protein [Alkalilimnicola sp. S0819]MPQ17666.1 EAL domain-containing protein [Alkalilimnicola sp. S0819]